MLTKDDITKRVSSGCLESWMSGTEVSMMKVATKKIHPIPGLG